MVTWDLVNIGSGNGLVPDSTKPLPEPILTYRLLRSSHIHLRPISLEVLHPSVAKISLRITYLKFHSNVHGVNALNSLIHRLFLGHYCPNGTQAANEFPCPRGSFNNETRRTNIGDCQPCLGGKYCDQTGLSEPVGDCNAGTSFWCLSDCGNCWLFYKILLK